MQIKAADDQAFKHKSACKNEVLITRKLNNLDITKQKMTPKPFWTENPPPSIKNPVLKSTAACERHMHKTMTKKINT